MTNSINLFAFRWYLSSRLKKTSDFIFHWYFFCLEYLFLPLSWLTDKVIANKPCVSSEEFLGDWTSQMQCRSFAHLNVASDGLLGWVRCEAFWFRSASLCSDRVEANRLFCAGPGWRSDAAASASHVSYGVCRFGRVGPKPQGLGWELGVKSRFCMAVLRPSRAAVIAASQPAWPPPTTIRSKLSVGVADKLMSPLSVIREQVVWGWFSSSALRFAIGRNPKCP